MPKKYRDANGVSHYGSDSSIPKFPPRPRQKDFEVPVIPSDEFHKSLIRVDSDMPFGEPKGAEVGGKIVAEGVPTRFMRAPIQARPASQRFEKKAFSGLLRVD